MKRIFGMMMMAALAVALAGCGSDDEENEAKTTDTALTGTWVNWSDDTDRQINEAVSFKQNGEVLIHYDGWYHGNYSVTKSGQIQTHVSKIRMQNFRSFDDYEAYAVNPIYYDWIFFYVIKGKTLTMKQDGTYLTWTLERLEE